MPGGGGLMQLISYGAQYIFLTEHPSCPICSQEIENGFFGKDKFYHQRCKNNVIKKLNVYLYDDVVGIIMNKLI